MPEGGKPVGMLVDGHSANFREEQREDRRLLNMIPPCAKHGLAGLFVNVYMSVDNELETGMLAVIATLNFIINIAWFLIIASAIFSWLYAFNIINVNNQAINMIGRSLYQLTEPLYRPIRRLLPNMGGVDLSPLVVLVILYFIWYLLNTTIAAALLS
jgi:YggT family protein